MPTRDTGHMSDLAETPGRGASDFIPVNISTSSRSLEPLQLSSVDGNGLFGGIGRHLVNENVKANFQSADF